MAISLAHIFESDTLSMDQQDTNAIINIKAMQYEPEGEERKQLDLICVLDRSGSMHGDKMKLLKETCEFVIREMKPTDRLAFIAYDNTITVDLPLTNMDKDGKEKARQALSNIQPRGATNLSGGLLKGLELAKEAGKNGARNLCSVLLLTDGIANNGITGASAVANIVSDFTASLSNPPSVFTFGYGKDHDSEMLRGIADSGGGVYYFLEDNDSVATSFADCLGGLLTVAAQNITLKVTAVHDTTINKIHTKFSTKTVKEGCEYEISFNDMYSEEERDLLFSLSLPKCSSTVENAAALEFSLSYFSVPDSKILDTTYTATVNRSTKDVADRTKKNDKVAWQVGRVAATDALSKADRLGREGKFEEGREALEHAKIIIKKSPNYMKSPMCQQIMADLDESKSAMQDSERYRTIGQYQMKSKCMEHSYQRSCSSNIKTPNAYRSSAKASIMSRWEGQREHSNQQQTISENASLKNFNGSRTKSPKIKSSSPAGGSPSKTVKLNAVPATPKKRSNSIFGSLFGN